VNAILYQVRAGGSWRMLPKDFPPWETVYGYFARWRDDGTLDALHDALREQVRAKRERRNPWVMVGLMLNRLAPPPGPKPWASKRKRR
jgi:Putative transposase of IS4/5 family (DUF4096)